MSRVERVILTNMCMVYDEDRILVQNKVMMIGPAFAFQVAMLKIVNPLSNQ